MAHDTITVFVGGERDPRLDQILAKLEQMMSKNTDDFKALEKRIDDATNAIKARIDALVVGIVPGMTQDEVDQLKLELSAEADKLEPLGKSDAPPANS